MTHPSEAAQGPVSDVRLWTPGTGEPPLGPGGGPASAVLSRDEVHDLLRAADGSTYGARNRAIVAVAYSTAARGSELVRMTVGGLDVARARIRFARPKCDDEHLVPLHPAALGALLAYLGGRRFRDDEPLFCSRKGGRLTEAGLRDVFRRSRGGVRSGICVDAGLPASKSHPHVLRATSITHMIEQGVPLVIVARIAGHARIETTRGYTHLADGWLDKAVGALAL